jgi:hypothetical protein
VIGGIGDGDAARLGAGLSAGMADGDAAARGWRVDERPGLAGLDGADGEAGAGACGALGWQPTKTTSSPSITERNKEIKRKSLLCQNGSSGVSIERLDRAHRRALRVS